ncbi:Retrotransposon-derived protein PEG10 [Grifola frondosa]|uniref:Retrotransposon-derived protein PEG10 n=1 Tax=Grifola frondosa TaxID=5627 RepID=A0A1C7MI13_GRIFR|nr:Retrotransposon-derived protein PEG10 [Grifola frondosa]
MYPSVEGSSSTYDAPPPDGHAYGALLSAVVALGQHAMQFSEYQSQNQHAIEAVTLHLEHQQAQAAPTGTSSLHFHEPHVFTGKAEEVIPFLREIRNAVYLQRKVLPDDYDRAIYLAHTSRWCPGLLDRQHLLYNWEALLADFRSNFEDSDLVATSLDKLERLYQTGSAAMYSSRFKELLVYLDLSEETKKMMFHWNLKSAVKDLLVSIVPAKTFEDFVKQVIEVDNRFHEREVEKKHEKPSSSYSHLASKPLPVHHATMSSSSNDTAVPMEVDAVRCGPVSEAEKERHCKLGFQGKHLISACPNMLSRAKKTQKVPPKAGPSSEKPSWRLHVPGPSEQFGTWAPTSEEGTHIRSTNGVWMPKPADAPIYQLSSHRPVGMFALVDSGATASCISLDFANRHSLPRHLKDDPVPVMAVDDRPISTGLVTHDIITSLSVQSHSENISLGVVKVSFPVILGLDWLRRHNPAIDWARNRLAFSCCSANPSYPVLALGKGFGLA